ncbi:hypothetical protein BGZ72_008501 [Mortierella alpina]|nr:hypothetical protein BGZ72_008501 [Mortierella alpina]
MGNSLQEFCCKGDVIRIETITDSDGQQCVLWRDIRTAFPGMTRIQHGNVFVPIVKDSRFYRKKPHRILYHPGIVLDVIYMSDSPKTRSLEHSQGTVDTVQPHGENTCRKSQASIASYHTAVSRNFMKDMSDAGGEPAISRPEQSVPVKSIDGSSASSSTGGAASLTLSRSQAQPKHGAKPWFSGLMQTLPTLSSKTKGSPRVALSPPPLSLSSTSLATVKTSSGSNAKCTSPPSKLSIVPSSVSSSSDDSS